ncbi:hypothetical protein PCASD_02721 [Puccinia coronata f. sp. avenae]|uniref:Uncharacterized protein n=1 Tax=Puccinia coronata f. sp. avenae TaxID=200324 RepID=A0A2N5VH64_9BASI|nr:hypothetical protein PCASD_02721 [Puccinia coronata f. sp. avenae]
MSFATQKLSVAYHVINNHHHHFVVLQDNALVRHNHVACTCPSPSQTAAPCLLALPSSTLHQAILPPTTSIPPAHITATVTPLCLPKPPR